MSIAITDDHRALDETASDLLRKADARGAARALLEAPEETTPALWSEITNLGWLGLHVPEEHGGSGYTLEELVVVVEQLGRAVAPGAFVPTVIASAVIAAAGDDATKAALLPGIADGSRAAGVALTASVEIRDGAVHGSTGTVVGGGLADVVLVPVGDDVAVVEVGAGVTVSSPKNMDPTRRSARLSFEGAPATVIAGAKQTFIDLARVILSAEAVGIARECTEMAAEYAKIREQFGRPIAMYQGVKHHCANMLVATELATSAVWDAARAAADGGQSLTYAAAVAASLAGPAADLCANLNIQVHGGIGFTWEHDAHLYLRRATVLLALLAPDVAAAELVDLTRAGVGRAASVDLPPEAEPIRTEVRAFVDSLAGKTDDFKDKDALLGALIETGFVMPHWPKPWGRDAGAIEQLVIEEEFGKAGIKRPNLGITGWVILTLIQHGTEEQVARWVRSALTQEVVWCQLFSEPAAGSDAAGIKTKATRTDGGWIINGQKVWTSGAHVAGRGFATVRTNPDVPKHQGITTVVIDMQAKGLTVRPLRMISGQSEFNEVFFDDVFVPDEDVVGPVDGGWTVARATLGNESVSIGAGSGAMSVPPQALIGLFDQHPSRLAGGAARVGHFAAVAQAMTLMNLRSLHRAVAGGGPGPEGAVTKLVLSEQGHDAAAIASALTAEDVAYIDGPGLMATTLVMMHRAMSIAGGTSEIKRNQIGERLLGLPRDPLIK